MNAWLEIGLSNALVASILAALMWCLTRVVRRPQFAFILWSLVLVKLLVPGFGPAWTTWPVEMPAPQSISTAQETSPSNTAPSPADLTGAANMAIMPSSRTSQPATTAVAEFQDPASERSFERVALSWIDVAGIAWLSGSAIWLIVAVYRLSHFRRLLARTPLADAATCAEVAAICERMQLSRTPTVRMTSARMSPLVWSALGRATLLLPQELLGRLSADERETLIAHELAHLARRDQWVRWLELAAVGVYWWHPVAWWARRNVALAGELCCDATVVSLLPEKAYAYAHTLLTAVDFCAGPQAAIPLGSSSFSQGSSLKRRMEMILAAQQSQHLGWRLRLALATLAAMALPASFRTTAAAPPAAPAVAPSSIIRVSQAAKAGPSVEVRLDRLEKAVLALTAEIRAMRAADLDNAPPVVVKAIPENGAEDVDASLTEIRVTFSKDMQDGSWSWTQRSDDTFPEVTGKIHYLEDKRTCVLPVKLQPGKTYYLSINSERFRNFKDTGRRPAVPYPISFETKP